MKLTSLVAPFVTSLLMTGAFAVSAQEQKTSQVERAPAAAAQAEKKPAPPQKPDWAKGVPRFEPLSNVEKLKMAQGVKGLPDLTSATVTPYLTLYPGHLTDTGGSLTLGCPERDMMWLALYSGYQCVADTEIPPGGNFVDLVFQTDAGNVYMIDFAVVVGPLGNADPGIRNFQLTTFPAGQPLPPAPTPPFQCSPQFQPQTETQILCPQATSAAGFNHLYAFIFAQKSSYEALLQPLPAGRWFFLAVDVSKFVNVPQHH